MNRVRPSDYPVRLERNCRSAEWAAVAETGPTTAEAMMNPLGGVRGAVDDEFTAAVSRLTGIDLAATKTATRTGQEAAYGARIEPSE